MSPTSRPSTTSHLLTAALSAAIGGVIGFAMQSGPPLPAPTHDPGLAAVERSLAELSQRIDELRTRQAAAPPTGTVVAAPDVTRTADPTAADARLTATVQHLEQLVSDLIRSGSAAATERLRAARARKPESDLAVAAELHGRLTAADEAQEAALQREWMLHDMADVTDRLGSPTSLDSPLGSGPLGWRYELPDGESVTVWFRDGLVVYVDG